MKKLDIHKVSAALSCFIIGMLCTFFSDETLGKSASIKLVISVSSHFSYFILIQKRQTTNPLGYNFY